MTLTEQIYAQALVLIRDLQDGDRPMLEMLCRSAEVSLRAKLRDGVTPEACCLRYQAELMMIPYVKDRFAFMGV